jgi:acyl-coenzyme A synthetase/AMP-(fatty) acid ligase
VLRLLRDFQTAPIIAYRGSQAISRVEFLQDVLALAKILPETRNVINMCKDRYWFSVALFAAISRDIVSILPNAAVTGSISSIRNEVPDLVCLGDHVSPLYSSIPYLQVSDPIRNIPAGLPNMPRIPFDQQIIRVYTSGSTGKPQPHIKTFGRMVHSATAEAERMWAATGGPCSVLGTVPFQHMYGLESTVLLPILGGGCMSSTLPFYPIDIVSELAKLPPPRFLVTTPFHLRKLISAEVNMPAVAAILSATAPLSPELAEETEARFGAPLMEIYGSTETGQIATRRPTAMLEWETYPEIELKQENGATTVSGGHVETPQALNDEIELLSQTRFRLLGRNSDMINIAGKRNSLAFLNHVIVGLPGVQDGLFCMTENGSGNGVSRLMAFVVAPGQHSTDILAALRAQLDPVFLPRPVVFLDSLPRDENGKIPQVAVATLVAKYNQP